MRIILLFYTLILIIVIGWLHLMVLNKLWHQSDERYCRIILSFSNFGAPIYSWVSFFQRCDDYQSSSTKAPSPKIHKSHQIITSNDSESTLSVSFHFSFFDRIELIFFQVSIDNTTITDVSITSTKSSFSETFSTAIIKF